MYKLIAIDMDGTLLDTNGNLSSENIKAVKRAIDNDVKVVFTTGRGIKAISKFINEFGLNDKEEYAITNNGVSLYSTKTLKCLKSHLIEGEDLKRLCDLGLSFGAKLHIYDYDTEGCIVLEENEFTQFERRIGMPTYVDPNFCSKIDENKKVFKVLYLSNENRIAEIKNKIPDFVYEKFVVVRSLPFAVEIFDKNCNKGNAVRDLANMFDISRDKVIAIGDQQNDLEMIKFAGLGVAMGNAINEIKDIADYVTDTNDNDGVAKVINKFVFGF